MLDAKTIYGLLIYVISIVPLTLGLFLLLSSISKSPGLKSYFLSRKALAIAYLALGGLSVLEGVMMGDQLGDDIFLIANIYLVTASCQSYLFTYALIILIDPSFASHRWNRKQWCLITTGSIGTIVGIFLNIDILSYTFFFLFFTFYFYQLIFYTRLFLKKKRMYISRVDNYFSGNEISWLRWMDVAFFSALIIGIGALLSVVSANMWFINAFIAVCCVFYFFFALKYFEYPQLFDILQPVIKQELSNSSETDDKKQTLEEKLECWIKEKRFLQQGISLNDLARELDVKQSTVSFYINVHMQMNFKRWLLYLREKEQQLILKETQSKYSELFAKVEQLMINEQPYLNPDLSRDNLAKSLYSNTVYLNAAIREKTNMSFGDYINSLRLDYARNSLSNPKKSKNLISDIAIESGFKSLRTFNRAFKERFGITPEEGKERISEIRNYYL